MDDDDKILLAGIMIEILIGALMLALIIVAVNPIHLSQETADDICQQITGNQSAVGDSKYEKLICEIPTFDETQNIIIRGNDE